MTVRIGGFDDLRARVVQRLLKCGRTFDRVMVTERLSGPTSAESLSRRSGQLARSNAHAVTTSPTKPTLEVAIGGGVPYARAHEHGATITPKKSKYLAIPLGAARTAAGVGRVTSPRNWPNPLRVLRSRRGNLLLVETLAKARTVDVATGKRVKAGTFGPAAIRSKLRPVFVLKSEVTLPPRLGFGKTFKRVSQQCLQELRAEFGRIQLKKR